MDHAHQVFTVFTKEKFLITAHYYTPLFYILYEDTSLYFSDKPALFLQIFFVLTDHI